MYSWLYNGKHLTLCVVDFHRKIWSNKKHYEKLLEFVDIAKPKSLRYTHAFNNMVHKVEWLILPARGEWLFWTVVLSLKPFIWFILILTRWQFCGYPNSLLIHWTLRCEFFDCMVIIINFFFYAYTLQYLLILKLWRNVIWTPFRKH